MGPIARFFAVLPQESFAEVTAQRDATPAADPRQQALSVEDRRAFAREYTRDNGPLGAIALSFLIPAEQAAKAIAPVPSRTGFHNPLESIGGGYAGILQGLNDRGLFGSR